MDHFKGVNDSERYNNEMLQLQRRQVELLEQIAQLLQPHKPGTSESGKQGGKRQQTGRNQA